MKKQENTGFEADDGYEHEHTNHLTPDGDLEEYDSEVHSVGHISVGGGPGQLMNMVALGFFILAAIWVLVSYFAPG